MRADALNSTSVRVRWLPPDPQLVNGLNQGYRVEAWARGRVVGEGSPEATVTVSPNAAAPLEEHSAMVGGLRRYRSYNITVLCFTSPGNGPRSQPVLVTTKQDGELPCPNILRHSSPKLTTVVSLNGILRDQKSLYVLSSVSVKHFGDVMIRAPSFPWFCKKICRIIY